MDYGVALGRRFRALKLWFVMRSYGREGIAAMIREQVRIVQSLAAKIDAIRASSAPLRRRFRPSASATRGPTTRTARSRSASTRPARFFISGTELHGRFTLRLAIGNMATAQSHVDRVWELIQAEAAKLSG